ncbi:MAG: AMP-binding protein [Reichenbachiella sp.]
MNTMLNDIAHYSKMQPDSIAAISHSLTLTYKQLVERIDCIADYVEQAIGIEPAPVLCFLNNATDIAPVMSALFTMGHLYVPLDGMMGNDRLKDIIAQVSPSIVICTNENKTMLSEIEFLDSVPIVPIETIWANDTFPMGYFETQASLVDVEAPCYLFFTSGTTSTPKGIIGNVAGVSHFVLWQKKEFVLGAETVVGRMTQSVYDASLRDFYLPLCTGGRIVDSPEGEISPLEILKWIEKMNITVIHMVPSLLRVLMNSSQSIMGLRVLFLAGEVIHPQDVAEWYAHHDTATQLVNLYGPTETVMTKLFYRIQKDDASKKVIPIGQPIENVAVHFVASNNTVLSPGRIGEIGLSTPFKCLGYYNNDAEQKQKFRDYVIEGNVVYLTGDHGRQHASGDIEFLGRKDSQIKINGIRIELNTIENHLQNIPEIQEVCIEAIMDGVSTELVAFYCAINTVSQEECTAYLKKYISVVPHYYYELESFPRLMSGKVDRKQLKKIFEINRERGLLNPSDSASVFITTDDPNSIRVQRIWEEILRSKNIPLDESFFALGGDSLKTIALISELEHAFNISIPYAQFLEEPTIKKCVSFVNESVEKRTGPVICLNKSTKGPNVWLIHPPGGFVFCYSDLAYQLKSDCTTYALEYPLFHDGPRLTSMRDLVNYYVKHIIEYQTSGYFILGGWSQGGLIAHAVYAALLEKGLMAKKVLLLDTAVPYTESYSKEEAVCNSMRSMIAYASELFPLNSINVDDKMLITAQYLFKSYARLFFQLSLARSDIKKYYSKEVLLLAKMVSSQASSFTSLVHMALRTSIFIPDWLLLKVLYTLSVKAQGAVTISNKEWYKKSILSYIDNSKAVLSYFPEKISIPILHIQAENKEVCAHDVAQSISILTTQTVERSTIAGNHFTCLKSPNVKAMASVIQQIL